MNLPKQVAANTETPPYRQEEQNQGNKSCGIELKGDIGIPKDPQRKRSKEIIKRNITQL